MSEESRLVSSDGCNLCPSATADVSPGGPAARLPIARAPGLYLWCSEDGACSPLVCTVVLFRATLDIHLAAFARSSFATTTERPAYLWLTPLYTRAATSL